MLYWIDEKQRRGKPRRCRFTLCCILELRLRHDVGGKLRNGQADLLHGIPVAHGDGIIFKRIEIHRDAHRRADFILPAVPSAL